MDYVEMPLINGGFVILDRDQYDSLEHKDDWREIVRNRVIIKRGSWRKKTEQILHLELFPQKKPRDSVIHKNGNPYDFRKENIEIVSHSKLLIDLYKGRSNGPKKSHKRQTPREVSFEVNGCTVLVAPFGRCKNMLDCPDYMTCLDMAAARNWGGWTTAE